jgi:predicted nucleic acid-binding protein
MGVILVDTAILVDNLRNVAGAVTALDDARDRRDELLASVVTKTELLTGMRSPERRVTRDLMSTMTWIDVTEDIAELAGTWGRRYRRSHHNIGLADYLIGATAHQLGAALWTTNVRHFPMYRGLRAPY